MNARTASGGPQRSWPGLLGSVLNGRDLSEPDTAWVMDQVMRGKASDALIAGFLVALRAKGRRSANWKGWCGA